MPQNKEVYRKCNKRSHVRYKNDNDFNDAQSEATKLGISTPELLRRLIKIYTLLPESDQIKNEVRYEC